MKKSFFGGMLFLTLLGIGRLVYASSNSPLSHLKSSSNSNKLTAQNWDNLVAEVENLKALLPSRNNAPGNLQASIPDGAVMAFDLNQCPEGWVVYSGAKGKFIMGAEYNSDLKNIGGNANINLTVGQLPAHSFYTTSVIGWDGRGSSSIGWIRDHKEQYVIDIGNQSADVDGGGNEDTYYKLRATRSSANAGKTNTLGNGESINILNPHIKLIYCKKGGEGVRSLGNKPAPAPETPTPKCGNDVFQCAKGYPINQNSEFIPNSQGFREYEAEDSYNHAGMNPRYESEEGICQTTRNCELGTKSISCSNRERTRNNRCLQTSPLL